MAKKQTIVFQGEPGANSHIACIERFPDCEPVPCATFEDAFAAVSNGEGGVATCSPLPTGGEGRTRHSSRPWTWDGGDVASTAVNASRTR